MATFVIREWAAVVVVKGIGIGFSALEHSAAYWLCVVPLPPLCISWSVVPGCTALNGGRSHFLQFAILQ